MSDLTYSPRREKRAIAQQQQAHLGEEFASHSSRATMPLRSPQNINEIPSPLLPPSSRQGGFSSRTFGTNTQVSKRNLAVLILAMMATSYAVVLWFFTSNGKEIEEYTSTTSLRLNSVEAKYLVIPDHCSSRRTWVVPTSRAPCSRLLPSSPPEASEWLVGVHVDRAPALPSKLRGGGLHRELPHQYFVQAMKAILYTISLVEPGAHVNIVIFSDGRWGGMVDETGLPVNWDLSSRICDELGLRCTQNLVLLNDDGLAPDEVECLASADVMLASENEFSKAAVAMSNSVKVVTDQWQVDEDELMITLNPAKAIAGMRSPERAELKKVIEEWHECTLWRTVR